MASSGISNCHVGFPEGVFKKKTYIHTYIYIYIYIHTYIYICIIIYNMYIVICIIYNNISADPGRRKGERARE